MSSDLSFDLHALTARLDQAADRILQAEHGVSFRRFLALWHVGGLGAGTQRQLAGAMGLSEPSISRMAGVLAHTGLLEVLPDPMGGNRRRLSLTPAGEALVSQCRALLEQRFALLVEHSGVPYAEYARHTQLLIAALDGQPPPTDQEFTVVAAQRFATPETSRA